MCSVTLVRIYPLVFSMYAGRRVVVGGATLVATPPTRSTVVFQPAFGIPLVLIPTWSVASEENDACE